MTVTWSPSPSMFFKVTDLTSILSPCLLAETPRCINISLLKAREGHLTPCDTSTSLDLTCYWESEASQVLALEVRLHHGGEVEVCIMEVLLAV